MQSIKDFSRFYSNYKTRLANYAMLYLIAKQSDPVIKKELLVLTLRITYILQLDDANPNVYKIIYVEKGETVQSFLITKKGKLIHQMKFNQLLLNSRV